VPDLCVLLGAGASVDAGLPTTEGMVDRLLADFRKQDELLYDARPRLRLLEFIVYSLRQEAAARGDVVGVDVETMFDAIESLASRTRLSITPFINSWHPLVAEAERTTRAGAYDTPERRLGKLLTEAIKKTVASRFPMGSSTHEVDRFVQELLGSGNTRGSAFASLAVAVLESLGRILQLPHPDAVRYLEPLATLYHDQSQLDIATLNYDLTVETLGDSVGLHVDDGMAVWDRKGRLEFEPGIRLLKLHGSIGWETTAGVRPIDDPFIPVEGIRRTVEQTPTRPAVIFGAGNKLRANGPYLELLRLFTQSLEQRAALLVIGYSFRDEHVNAVLTTWLNGDRSRRIVILDPAVKRFGAYVPYEERGLAQELALLANRDAARVQLLEQPAAAGLVTAIEIARKGVSPEPEPGAGATQGE
jgi:SIR2-like domain